jgi:hypothetical protein
MEGIKEFWKKEEDTLLRLLLFQNHQQKGEILSYVLVRDPEGISTTINMVARVMC